MESKTEWLAAFDEARDYLWRELAALSDHAEISPGTTKRELYAHIAGWEAGVFEGLRAYLYGIPISRHPYHGLDAINAEFQAERQSATIESAKLEGEINRFAIRIMLEAIPESDLGHAVRLRWGEQTVGQLIQGAIDHEREHADEIAKLRQAGRL